MFAKYITPFMIIRRFIRSAKKYGYNVSISEKHEGSCYVDFCKINSTLIDFKFRFSDHWLSENNQIPAGVINEKTDLEFCVKDIPFYINIYNNMGILEKQELWTNRYNN